jgi:hypothetical protein
MKLAVVLGKIHKTSVRHYVLYQHFDLSFTFEAVFHDRTLQMFVCLSEIRDLCQRFFIPLFEFPEVKFQLHIV